MKEWAPWGYKPNGPFYLFTFSPACPGGDEPFKKFDELLDIWVRNCMMPTPDLLTAIIMDDDGVPVIGWHYVEGELVWLGLDWAWKRLDRYPSLRPLTIEEARIGVMAGLGELQNT